MANTTYFEITQKIKEEHIVDTSSHILTEQGYKQLIAKQRRQSSTKKNDILKKILNTYDITKKCLLLREYSSPQSTYFETIIRRDLKLNKPINEISGDGTKNGKNYEIKASIHDKKSKFNWVQIRPDHNVHFYILIGFNIHEDELGKVYNYKIPSEELYKIIAKYGGYAHGTCKKLGKITLENIKGRNCEFALRVDPNSSGKKNIEIMKALENFITPYEEKYY